tara:strand:- start:415 stop:780 length:366 start_codon:yes stop_codon:yes gene_type:complete
MNYGNNQQYFTIQEVVPLLKAYEIALDTCIVGSQEHTYYKNKIRYLFTFISKSNKMAPFVEAIEYYTTAHRVNIAELDSAQLMAHKFYLKVVNDMVITPVVSAQEKKAEKLRKAEADRFHL